MSSPLTPGVSKRRICSNLGCVYVDQHTSGTKVEDLEHHECLTFSDVTHWHFLVNGEDQSVRVSSRFSSSGVDGFLGACLSGLGLAQLSEWDIKDELQRGSLVAIDLQNATPRSLAI